MRSAQRRLCARHFATVNPTVWASSGGSIDLPLTAYERLVATVGVNVLGVVLAVGEWVAVARCTASGALQHLRVLLLSRDNSLFESNDNGRMRLGR